MKKLFILGFVFGFLLPGLVSPQRQVLTDSANGDWTLQHIVLQNTTEADLMVRSGDR